MRIAWPFSSGTRLTSPMIAPPLARIGSMSMRRGLVEHQPHGVGAAEQRRGRRRWQRKRSRAGLRCRAAPRSKRTCRCLGFPADARTRPASCLRCRRGSQGFLRRRSLSDAGAASSATAASPSRREAGAFSAAGVACSAAGAAFSVVGRWRASQSSALRLPGLISILACSAIALRRDGAVRPAGAAASAPWPACHARRRAIAAGLTGAAPGRNRSLRRGGAVRFCHDGFSACWKATSTM